MKNSKKKAQVKFGETFGIIIIVYVVIIVGMVWYNKVNTNNVYEMQQEDALNKAFEKYNYMLNSPLLHLSQQGDIDEEFDLQALKIFYEYSQGPGIEKEFIREQLGEATIVVKIYNKSLDSNLNNDDSIFIPAPPDIPPTILIYNNTPISDTKKVGENKILLKNTYRTLIPVVDNIGKITKLGILEVTVYD